MLRESPWVARPWWRGVSLDGSVLQIRPMRTERGFSEDRRQALQRMEEEGEVQAYRRKSLEWVVVEGKRCS